MRHSRAVPGPLKSRVIAAHLKKLPWVKVYYSIVGKCLFWGSNGCVWWERLERVLTQPLFCGRTVSSVLQCSQNSSKREVIFSFFVSEETEAHR